MAVGHAPTTRLATYTLGAKVWRQTKGILVVLLQLDEGSTESTLSSVSSCNRAKVPEEKKVALTRCTLETATKPARQKLVRMCRMCSEYHVTPF